MYLDCDTTPPLPKCPHYAGDVLARHHGVLPPLSEAIKPLPQEEVEALRPFLKGLSNRSAE